MHRRLLAVGLVVVFSGCSEIFPGIETPHYAAITWNGAANLLRDGPEKLLRFQRRGRGFGDFRSDLQTRCTFLGFGKQTGFIDRNGRL